MVSFNEEFHTGVSFMDDGTKRFINELNKLSDAMKSGHGRQYVVFALDFLTEYANKHLITEEKVMIRYRFHDMENHAVRHDEFRAVLDKVMAEYEKRGSDPSFPLLVQRTMSSWLARHVSRADKVLGDFLVAKAKNQTTSL